VTAESTNGLRRYCFAARRPRPRGGETGRDISVEALIFTKTEKRINRMNEYREIFSNFRIPIFEVCKSESLPKSIETGRTIWESAPTGFAAADYYDIITHVFLGTDDE